jgi:hypothetical protein
MSVTTALLSGPASADTLTIGCWDQALGGGVTQLATSPGTPIQLIGNPLMLGTGLASIRRCCASFRVHQLILRSAYV